jgi:hypothetical protein
MAGLLDFLQGASNAAASNVSGPVDGLAWLLRKAGVDVGTPVGGSDWMAQKGLTKPTKGLTGLLGEAAGLSAPIVAAAKAPQIAAGLLNTADDWWAYNKMLGPVGTSNATVWHGSPHKFDKFDSAHIGKGEGAQAYGHGLYLADSPGVAKSYAENLTKTFDSIGDVAKHWRQNGGEAAYKAFAKEAGLADNDIAPVIEAMRKQGGNLYKVDLPDEQIAKMLDWDKPLSQQAPEVQKALRELAEAGDADSIARWLLSKGNDPHAGALFKASASSMPGVDQMANYPGSAQMSAAMRSRGIPGIRYLDGNSRGAGQGTSNYVVFPGNEGLLSILERNGVPLK